MTYRDKTFCSYYLLCKDVCDKALTPEVWNGAQKAGLPIGVFAEQPDCLRLIWGDVEVIKTNKGGDDEKSD